jgi:hypothetical protein
MGRDSAIAVLKQKFAVATFMNRMFGLAICSLK